MIRRAGVLAIIGLAARPVDAAPTAAELEARGQALATDRRFTEAIEAFKAADRASPRAIYACEIGLAYTRRELWTQAELFFASCHERATSADALPDWVNRAEQLLHDRLAQLGVASVDIVVVPGDARAVLALSSFAPDESFDPRKIHLPTGHHVITARAPGFEDEQVGVDITDQRSRRIVVRLYRPGERNIMPLHEKLAVAGGVALGGAAIAYGVMGICWLHLRDGDPAAFRDWQSTGYDVAKWTSIPLWALGGTLLATALYLRHEHRSSTELSVAALRGGGAAMVRWSW